MSTLGDTHPTLHDIQRHLDPDGQIARVIELLMDRNEVLDDVVFLEANGITSHQTTVRTGYPAIIWRLLNYGTPPSKSRTAQITDSIGMLSGVFEADRKLVEINNVKAAYMLSQTRSFLEAFRQELASSIFYANTALDPEEFMGLAPRYDDIPTDPTDDTINGYNIIDAGGTGSDNASIWIIVWGPDTVHGVYPKGSQAGLRFTDMGLQTLTDSAGGRYVGYQQFYDWDYGLCVPDWRYICRICNIDRSELLPGFATGANLNDLVVQGLERVENLSAGRAAIYCDRTIKTWFRRQTLNTTNVNLLFENVLGKEVLTLAGVPVRRCDALFVDEARVT